MGRFSRKFCNWAVNWLDFPQDIISDTPRFTMISNRQLIIENHRGIVHFSNELVRLMVQDGELEISGKEFIIRMIWPEEIQIEGTIHCIKYNGMEELP